MSASVADSARSVIVDSGVLVAAIDADEADHVWSVRSLSSLRGRFVTCEACITEAVHLLGNSAPAVAALRRLVERMTVVSFADGPWSYALAEVVRFSPNMDFADACVVQLVRSRRDAFALTLDRSDFATYKVPFACPDGEFYT
ncbi:MAG TPA: PIN domain-containing protein [Opitutaceae bacterium]|nr:PIN domain-containing protein [Opitutaceae bacterium]